MEQNPQPPQQSPAPDKQEDLLSDVYDDSMEGYDKPIKRARTWLFVIAGLQLVAIVTAIPAGAGKLDHHGTLCSSSGCLCHIGLLDKKEALHGAGYCFECVRHLAGAISHL
jgi:hypothetical protein